MNGSKYRHDTLDNEPVAVEVRRRGHEREWAREMQAERE